MGLAPLQRDSSQRNVHRDTQTMIAMYAALKRVALNWEHTPVMYAVEARWVLPVLLRGSEEKKCMVYRGATQQNCEVDAFVIRDPSCRNYLQTDEEKLL